MSDSKSHMFWTADPHIHYEDGHSIPRVTYRCKATVRRNDKFDKTLHQCKLVTDHPHKHVCVCGQEFGM